MKMNNNNKEKMQLIINQSHEIVQYSPYLSMAGISLMAMYTGQISILDDLYSATPSVLKIIVRSFVLKSGPPSWHNFL